MSTMSAIVSRWALPLLLAACANVPVVSASEDLMAELKNISVQYWCGWIWVSIIGTFITYQIVLHLIRYVRMVACLNNEKQRYFAAPNEHYGKFKRYLLDAPLLRTRHHREFQLTSVINVGTLPSRLQMLFLAGYLGTNVLFCVFGIDWHGTKAEVAPELRNRTGVLAVINMIPLFILAGRNNPFIALCGISFDTFNLIHRWFGRIVVLEALAHTVAYLVTATAKPGGWATFAARLGESEFILSGFIGTVAFVFLLLHSPSAIRHAFYETFLTLHILVAALGVAGVWIHCKSLPQIKLMYAVVAIWVGERGLRLYRLIRRNVGAGGTSVEVEALPGDACRVTIRMARPWKFRPGQHVYLYIPSIGFHTNHPFSLAWSAEEEDSHSMATTVAEKGMPVAHQDLLSYRKTSMSLIIRRRTGFTDKLFTRAAASPSGRFSTTGFLEGPYGGENLASYGTVMLWAAGIGIAHQVPHVRDIVCRFGNGTTATRRLSLVWVIQSPEHLEWIRPWMTTILALPRRREVLRIMIFVTRPRSTREIHSPSASVQMFPGKPNVDALVEQEMLDGVGAACVSICGTGSLADTLRRAVRVRETRWNVDFREESFSW